MPTLYSWSDASPHSSGYRLLPLQTPLDARTANAQFHSLGCVSLSFSKLSCFEVITDQFTAWGIEIKDAIAIKPSNFAFPSCIDQIVLIPLTRHNCITIQFNRPRQAVTVSVVAPHSIQLAAYDRGRHLLTQSTMSHSNSMLRADEIQPLPSQILEATGNPITHITMRSSAPFALQSIAYS